VNIFESFARRLAYRRGRSQETVDPEIQFSSDGKVNRRMDPHLYRAAPLPVLDVIPSKADYCLEVVRRVHAMGPEGIDEATHAYMDHVISADADSWRRAAHRAYLEQISTEQALHADEESLANEKQREAALLKREIDNHDASYVAARNQLMGEESTATWDSVLTADRPLPLPVTTPVPGTATLGRTRDPSKDGPSSDSSHIMEQAAEPAPPAHAPSQAAGRPHSLAREESEDRVTAQSEVAA
jgi:hypothetical protein